MQRTVSGLHTDKLINQHRFLADMFINKKLEKAEAYALKNMKRGMTPDMRIKKAPKILKSIKRSAHREGFLR